MSHMKWSTSSRPSQTKKSRGQKKRKRLKYEEKQELHALCDRIAEIVGSAGTTEKLVILEAAIIRLIENLDAKTRDGVFKSINVVAQAKEHAEQEALISQRMLEAIDKKSKPMEYTIFVQNFTDIIIEQAKHFNIDDNIRNNVLKAIITRLAFELDYNALKFVANAILPNMVDVKERADMRYMYG